MNCRSLRTEAGDQPRVTTTVHTMSGQGLNGGSNDRSEGPGDTFWRENVQDSWMVWCEGEGETQGLLDFWWGWVSGWRDHLVTCRKLKEEGVWMVNSSLLFIHLPARCPWETQADLSNTQLHIWAWKHKVRAELQMQTWASPHFHFSSLSLNPGSGMHISLLGYHSQPPGPAFGSLPGNQCRPWLAGSSPGGKALIISHLIKNLQWLLPPLSFWPSRARILVPPTSYTFGLPDLSPQLSRVPFLPPSFLPISTTWVNLVGTDPCRQCMISLWISPHGPAQNLPCNYFNWMKVPLFFLLISLHKPSSCAGIYPPSTYQHRLAGSS